MQWVNPEYLDLPEAEHTVNWPMWKVCIGEIQQVQRLKTPQEKQSALNRAIMAISKAYSLSFPDKPKGASSDYIIPAFIVNLVKAKIQHPFAI